MIALVTDSGSQITPGLVHRLDVGVVPLTVVLDGEALLEGVDLTASTFYRRLQAGAEVSTSAPSPGLFLEAYRTVAGSGATEIVSVHTGSQFSGTLNAASIAADESPVPVELVDTGSASFPVTMCVWAAHDALVAGSDSATAATAARDAAERVGSVFVVGATDLVRAGGRVPVSDDVAAGTTVLALEGSELVTVEQVSSVEEAVVAMAGHIRTATAGRPARIGVGDAVVPDLAQALEDHMTDAPGVTEVVRYLVGPSIGAHMGAETVGAVYLTA